MDFIFIILLFPAIHLNLNSALSNNIHGWHAQLQSKIEALGPCIIICIIMEFSLLCTMLLHSLFICRERNGMIEVG